MRGSIDIGSNSILLLILSDDDKALANESRVTGLGRGLDENLVFNEEAMRDSYQAFKEYFEICKKIGMKPSDVVVTATEASRVAKNSQEFFSRIKSEFGFQVTIITGEAEAYFSTMGVLHDKNINDKEITIMDIGGASTELIRVDVEAKKIIKSFSMPVGVIRLNNWALEEQLTSNMQGVLRDYEKDLKAVGNSKIYCVAGTMTSVGNMFLENKDYRELEVHGLEMSLEQIQNMLQAYQELSEEEILRSFPFLGKRAKSIQSGFILAEAVLQRLGCESVYISTYGLRYGTIYSGGVEDGFIFKN